MNNDLISRSELKKAMQTEIANVPQPDTDADYYVGVKQGLKLAETLINNASTVSSEITEKQAILLLINNGWLVNHDKELREKWERPQGEWKVYAHQGGIPIADYCTNCKYEMKWYRNKYNFCPKCGAKMLNGCISVFS